MHNIYNNNNPYFSPFFTNAQAYNPFGYTCPYWISTQMNKYHQHIPLKDYGPEPFVVNIEDATLQNNNYRTALWTGKHLQLTLMCINVGDDIGLEMHPDVDQFIRIEKGQGIAFMGDTKDNLTFRQRVCDNYVILVPAGTWHNLVNTGNTPIKLYTLYAPPNHPHGTVHITKAEAEEDH